MNQFNPQSTKSSPSNVNILEIWFQLSHLCSTFMFQNTDPIGKKMFFRYIPILFLQLKRIFVEKLNIKKIIRFYI